MSDFDITKGQPGAWAVLSRSVSAGRPASAYLVHGQDGLGHWPLALDFAALLNCEQPARDPGNNTLRYPCRKCAPCRGILTLNHEAIIPVVPIRSYKSNSERIDLINEALDSKRSDPLKLLTSTGNVSISIESAREVKSLVSRKASPGVTRVVLFYRMETMAAGSADALLKLLEEPPSDTILVLTTSKPEVLLPTIHSRCRSIRLSRVSEELLLPYFVEQYQVSEKKASLVSRISEGNPGRAISLLEEMEGGEQPLRVTGFQLFKAIFDYQGPALASLVTELVNPNNRGEVHELITLWQSLLRDCIWIGSTGEDENIINIDFRSELVRLAAALRSVDAAEAIRTDLKLVLEDLRRNVHIQSSLLALLLRLRTYTAAAG